MEQQVPTRGQMRKIVRTLRQKGATVESVQQVIRSGILADVFDPTAQFDDREALRAALSFYAPPRIFRLRVNYGLSRDGMIQLGHYDGVDDMIKCFHLLHYDGTADLEARYFRFNDDVHPEETATNTTLPWRPAEIDDLLSFGAAFPEEQRRFSIIGLGSTIIYDRMCYVPALDTTRSNTRVLRPARLVGMKSGDKIRFLGVRDVR